MTVRILTGDCREIICGLPAESVNAIVTSPPYFGLRSYLPDGHQDKAKEVGLERSPEEFVASMVDVFGAARRVLHKSGLIFLNLGDCYAGSGKGGNPGHSEHVKQRSNSGSLSVRGRKQDCGTLKPKDLMGIPWATAFALRDDGWYLRSAIVWAKPNSMPGSQEDRTTSSYEMIFMLSRSASYWSDFDAIKTPPRESTLVRTAQDVQAQAGSHRANGGAKTNGSMKAVGGHAPTQRRSDKQRGHGRVHAGFNDRWDAMEKSEQQARPAMMRDVWFVSPAGYEEAHFAVMPDEIARRCILAGCPTGGAVLDPFGGAGTVGLVADRLQRDAILIDLNPEYAEMAARRIRADAGLTADVRLEAVAA